MQHKGPMGTRRRLGVPALFNLAQRIRAARVGQQLRHRPSRGPDLGGVDSQKGVACLVHSEGYSEDNSGRDEGPRKM